MDEDSTTYETCIICLEEDDKDNLILPCKCTKGYTHRGCLNEWRKRFPKMHVHRIRCTVCKTDYTVPVTGFLTIQIDHDEEEIVLARRFQSRQNKSCKRQFLLQIIYGMTLFTTFFYILLAEPNQLINHNWNSMHILFDIQFFQGIIQSITYTLLARDLIIMILSAPLYYFFLLYYPLLILVGNGVLFLFSIFKLCLVYDI